MSEAFIEKYAEKLNWFHVSWYTKLSIEFLIRNVTKINWPVYLAYQDITEKLLDTFKSSKSLWKHLSIRDNFWTPEILEKYSEYLNWSDLVQRQKLPEYIIEKYVLHVGIMDQKVRNISNWVILSKKQELSESFMEKYGDFLDWEELLMNQKYSDEFAIKNLSRIKGFLRYIYVNQPEKDWVKIIQMCSWTEKRKKKSLEYLKEIKRDFGYGLCKYQ